MRQAALLLAVFQISELRARKQAYHQEEEQARTLRQGRADATSSGGNSNFGNSSFLLTSAAVRTFSCASLFTLLLKNIKPNKTTKPKQQITKKP
ncbi:hypothetical protein NX88_11650, partial [Neisseria meningitidis]